MINAPTMNGNVPAQNQKPKQSYAPSYNAVQINLDTPTLNAAPPEMPYYPPVNVDYQQVPQYTATNTQQTPVVPAPQITENNPAETAPVVETPNDATAPEAAAEKAFKGLCSSDYDEQALAMEGIAAKGLNNSADAVPYVQENILDKLVEITGTDSKNLAGPTDKQIELRNKIMENENFKAEQEKAGKDVSKITLPNNLSAQEIEEANKLSPFEQAERNKEYAMFTIAILDKTYADELQKQTGTVPPLTELPGSNAIVSTLKQSENPGLAVSAIDALRYIQRPEYKDDLTTLYTMAQKDSRKDVANAATAALNDLK